MADARKWSNVELGCTLRKIHLEPGGKELAMEKTPIRTRVVVPKSEVHSMVVGELEPKK